MVQMTIDRWASLIIPWGVLGAGTFFMAWIWRDPLGMCIGGAMGMVAIGTCCSLIARSTARDIRAKFRWFFKGD